MNKASKTCMIPVNTQTYTYNGNTRKNEEKWEENIFKEIMPKTSQS